MTAAELSLHGARIVLNEMVGGFTVSKERGHWEGK